MRIGLSKQTISNKLQSDIFDRCIWSIIGTPQEMYRYTISPGIEPKIIFNILDTNLSRKVKDIGGKLQKIYIKVGDVYQVVNYKNANDLMGRAIIRGYPFRFDILIVDEIFQFDSN